MKTKSQILSILFIPAMFLLQSCRKETVNKMPSPPDYSENYKYYPMQNGYEWDYTMVQEDSLKVIRSFDQRNRYSKDSGCTNTFRNGQLWSYMYWTNYSNRMGCCNDMVLLDYSLLGCNSDSVQIYSKKTTDYEISIHQYCAVHYATEVANYNSVRCIKTTQTNKYTSGNSIVIIRYFAYGVGLVFDSQTYYNNIGRMYYRETLLLKTHRF